MRRLALRTCMHVHARPGPLLSCEIGPYPSGGSALHSGPLPEQIAATSNEPQQPRNPFIGAHLAPTSPHLCPPRPPTHTRCIHCSGSCLTPRPGVGGSQPISTPFVLMFRPSAPCRRFPAHAAAPLPTPRFSVPSSLASCHGSQMLAFVASQYATDHRSTAEVSGSRAAAADRDHAPAHG